MTTYTNLFKSKYPSLKGKDWIKSISTEDQKVFVSIGAENHFHGVLGGMARAASAKRDHRGRFAPNTNPILSEN